MTIRHKIFLATAVILALSLNYAIYAKERVIANGETVLLKLAPVDPRSLMQGDYMRLAYDIERQINRDKARKDMVRELPKRGYIVIKPDADNVGQFVRFHDKNIALSDGEKLLRYHRRYTRVEIFPRSFLFQEGHRRYYERAKYGIFKFDKAGERVLTGLADEARKQIDPLTEQQKKQDG